MMLIKSEYLLADHFMQLKIVFSFAARIKISKPLYYGYI